MFCPLCVSPTASPIAKCSLCPMSPHTQPLLTSSPTPTVTESLASTKREGGERIKGQEDGPIQQTELEIGKTGSWLLSPASGPIPSDWAHPR
mmetsp:Transcript_132318/g.229421  ORF Transcript_132318/g.229421 Transcript_132318/m.229421 type:complete len:92 (-) Transcript_132318:627-902(-)